MSEPKPPGRSTSRDRLLAFAFAGADLLVEIEPNAIITWAAGAFMSRFGRSAESFVGGSLASLIASSDHDALGRTLFGTTLRGHTPPVELHLSDAASTPCALAALILPGPLRRLCVRLGPLPSAPPARSEGVQPASVFTQEAVAQVRGKQATMLGLLDLKGWDIEIDGPDGAPPGVLRAAIGEALGSVAGPGTIVGEISQGRYGIVSQRQVDIVVVASALEALIQARPGGRTFSVDGRAIGMSAAGLNPAQAARALRYALSRFAEGGLAAVDAGGLAAGLAGFMTQAKGQASVLRDIITGRQFQLVFQPVVSLADRSVHHYEALLRPAAGAAALWQGTQDFVTAVEALGLAEELDIVVLEQVLDALARAPEHSIAANISGISMQSAPFREKLLAALPTGSYRRLLIELTETAEIEDVAAAGATLDRLRASNIGLCLDDFGAGAAAFRYLRDFRFDFVKIDGAYVQGAVRTRRERAVVASMLDLSRSVGAQAIAEMIETPAQARLMQELGCTFGQGWLFGRPGPLPGLG